MNVFKAAIASVPLLVGTPVAMVAVTTTTGCASQQAPEQTYFQVNEAYIAVLTTLLQAKNDGLISDEQWDDINVQIQTGNMLLDDLHAAVQSGDTEGVQILKSMLRSVLIRLNDHAFSASNGGE